MKGNLEDNAAVSLPDPHRTRRFALVTGLILTTYIFAGGHIKSEVRTPLVDLVSFDHPWVLLLFLALISAYAAFRYWYYAIRIPLTRRKVRNYLRTPESILVFMGRKQDYRNAVEGGTHTDYSRLHSHLIGKSPAGFDPYDLVVGAAQQHSNSIAWDQIRMLVARQFDSYFPGITYEEIRTGDRDMSLGSTWASVYNLKVSTQLRTLVEDVDLFLPVYLNVLALFLLSLSLFLKLPFLHSQ